MNNIYSDLVKIAAENRKTSLENDSYKRKMRELFSLWNDELNESEENEGKNRESFLVDMMGLLEILNESDDNLLKGQLLTKISELLRENKNSERVMKRLLQPEELPKSLNPVVLVINPGSTSTKVAWFEGLQKLFESEVHLSPDLEDTVESRSESIIKWMEKNKLRSNDLDGVACRGGFIKPVPSGTYKITHEIISDLKHPRINHASNMAIQIGEKIAEMAEKDLLVTTSDPVVCDEIDFVDRVTGFIKIKMDGTGAHYLNHKAMVSFMASILEKKPNEVNCITAHIGGGTSIARHFQGKVTSLIDAFSGIPSANRAGRLDLPRLIEEIENNNITLKELKSATFATGGLLSLAGTNDFRALTAFIKNGATREQCEKIALIFDFYALQIANSIMKLTGDGRNVEFAVITGGVARSPEISSRLKTLIAQKIPLVFIPGSIEHESLAANLIKGILNPANLKDYVWERDNLHEQRRRENKILDTTIFERTLKYRKHGSPITSLDELIDSAVIKVKERFIPVVGIIGADNEEAILAAKRANEAGKYKIAKFRLIGDYTAINKIAYDYDLVIDDDNFVIDDSDDPVARGIELFDEGKVNILMKGSLHTDEILRGLFRYLKKTGKISREDLISHSVIMDIPTKNKLVTISDAAVNPYPDKEKKIKIIKNNIKVASFLNIHNPKIAIISAVENVNKSVMSSVEADELAKYFGPETNAIIEGPLSFDVAMNPKIATEKKYSGKIIGNADVLIVPDIDAGNILYKTLTTQSGAICAGLILAGKIPMILTSRGDSARSKLSSISLGVSAFFNLNEG